MTRTQDYVETLDIIHCGACGVVFGMTENHHRKMKRTGDWFYCPNGHKIHYCESETDRQRKRAERAEAQAASEQARRAQAEQKARTNEARRRAEKAAKTKLKNRVKHGVCPCCNRTFQDLQRHMTNKHPEYVGSE